MPIERAWDVLRDLRNAIHWVPGLARVEISTAKLEGVGASRRVFTARGPGSGGMDETVIEWTEGVGFRVRLHDGEAGPPAPFREGWFRYTLLVDGDQSRIETEMKYSMRWGALGRALDRLAVCRVTSGTAQKVATGFARYAERGGSGG